MISEISWENTLWLKKSFLNGIKHVGGSLIAVDSFRPYLKRSWIKRLKPATARQQFFREIEAWADELKKTSLTTTLKLPHWERGLQVARGGDDYSRLMWFLFRAHYNLYCLATHRKTIEELALGAFTYASPKIQHTVEIDTAAIADFRYLLRVSNTFLLAEWVHDMIERAIANEDKLFFNAMSNSVKQNILADPSPSALNWLLVILLWFLGGRDYDRRREFLHELHMHDILPKGISELTLNAELARLGLTKI